MQMSGNGAQLQFDFSAVITRVKTKEDARQLPAGTIVGDQHGGLTFTDSVASELERRSHCGWYDVASGTNDHHWTVIVLNR